MYSDIYCHNFTDYAVHITAISTARISKTGGDIYGNVYCDGDVTLSSISVKGSIISNGNVAIDGATALGNILRPEPSTCLISARPETSFTPRQKS